jgi:hypothetical protein
VGPGAPELVRFSLSIVRAASTAVRLIAMEESEKEEEQHV